MYNARMADGPVSIGQILKDKNIILKGADAATARGFTQVPNFLLKSKKLSSGDKMTFAMLLSYAWQNDFCFPGQERLAEDLGLSDRSVRTHLKSLEANGLLAIQRRGQGKTNTYELNLSPGRV
jgi:biotin operon repressor